MERLISLIATLRKNETFKKSDLDLIENLLKSRKLNDYTFAHPKQVFNDSYTSLNFKNVLEVYFEDLDIIIYSDTK